MSDLQITYYIASLVFMGIVLIIIFMILTAVLKMKAKIDHVHYMIDKRVSTVKDTTERFATIVRTVMNFVKM